MTDQEILQMPISQIRQLLGCTQADMQMYLGISRATLTLAESAKRKLPTQARSDFQVLTRNVAIAYKCTLGSLPAVDVKPSLKRSTLQRKLVNRTKRLNADRGKLQKLVVLNETCQTALRLLQAIEIEGTGKSKRIRERWRQILILRMHNKLATCDFLKQTELRVSIASGEAEIQLIHALIIEVEKNPGNNF
jgi:transcriptional regulator with XRE-family HTH domain